jgi:GxxExxY protein
VSSFPSPCHLWIHLWIRATPSSAPPWPFIPPWSPGFHEVIYHQALTLEFEERNIPARPEVRLPVYYNGRRLGATYRVDFVCFDSIVVELKALASVSGPEAAQLLNYLKATGCHLGLLLKFRARRLEHRSVVWGQPQ